MRSSGICAILPRTCIAFVASMLYGSFVNSPLQAAMHTDGETNLNITNSLYDGKAPELLAKIAERFQLSALNSIAKGTSTAQSLATMGAGTAYASGRHSFIVGGGGGVAVNGVDQSIGQVARKLGDLGGDNLPRFGIGSQVSAVVGMNLGNLRAIRYIGPLELSRLTILANFMNFSSDAIAGLNLSATVAGLHAQYRLADSRGSAAFSYGEVLLVTGFDYSRLNARYDSTTGARSLTPITVGAATPANPQLTWNPAGVMQLTSGSGTLPIELVTQMRMLWLLSFYLGMGADINVGRASADIQLSGTLTGTTGGAPTTVGSGSLNTSRSASPQLLSARGFAGFQINLLPAKATNILGVFAQTSITSIGGFAVQAGLRFAW